MESIFLVTMGMEKKMKMRKVPSQRDVSKARSLSNSSDPISKQQSPKQNQPQQERPQPAQIQQPNPSSPAIPAPTGIFLSVSNDDPFGSGSAPIPQKRAQPETQSKSSLSTSSNFGLLSFDDAFDASASKKPLANRQTAKAATATEAATTTTTVANGGDLDDFLSMIKPSNAFNPPKAKDEELDEFSTFLITPSGPSVTSQKENNSVASFAETKPIQSKESTPETSKAQIPKFEALEDFSKPIQSKESTQETSKAQIPKFEVFEDFSKPIQSKESIQEISKAQTINDDDDDMWGNFTSASTEQPPQHQITEPPAQPPTAQQPLQAKPKKLFAKHSASERAEAIISGLPNLSFMLSKFSLLL